MSQESKQSKPRTPSYSHICSKGIIELAKPKHLILEKKQKEANMIPLEEVEHQIKLKRKKQVEKSKNFGKLLQNFENNQNKMALDQIYKKLSKISIKEILKETENGEKKNLVDENRERLIKTAFDNIYAIKPDADCDLVFQISKIVANFVEPLNKYN